MAAPSLSEITNIKGDADIAAGTSGNTTSDVVLPLNKGMEALQTYAAMKANHDALLYKQFQDNIANFYTNLSNIDMSKVLPEDVADLRKTYADVAQVVSDNIGAVRNPMSDPEGYGKVMKAVGGLRSDIANSAGWQHYIDNANSFMTSNKQWGNSYNQAAIRAIRNTPRRDRVMPQLRPSYSLDLTKKAELVTKQVAQKFAQTYKDPSIVPGHNYVTTVEGTNFIPEDWDNGMLAAMKASTTGTNELSDYDVLASQYAADPSLQQQFKNGPDEYVRFIIQSLRPKNSITKMSSRPEDFEKQDIALAAAAHQKALDRAQREAHWKATQQDKAVMGEAYNRELTNMLTANDVSQDILQTLYGDNNPTRVNILNNKGKVIATKNVVSSIADGNKVLPGDKVLIKRRRYDQASNTWVPDDIIRTFDQVREDMYGMYGQKMARTVLESAAPWRAKKGLNPNSFDLGENMKYFNKGVNQNNLLYDANNGNYTPFTPLYLNQKGGTSKTNLNTNPRTNDWGPDVGKKYGLNGLVEGDEGDNDPTNDPEYNQE